MAHCVHSDERETERIKKNGVFIAHCPESNMNLSSGVAPIRAYLEQGLKVGSFELGFEMDAIVLDDSQLKHPQKLTVQQRLERMIYCSDDRQIYAKYVAGEKLF